MSQPHSEPQDSERVVRHERRLRLLVLHLMGRALRARLWPDDVVQEVYLRALSTPSGLPRREDEDSGDSVMWRFLSRIARNTIVDAARAARAAKRSGTIERIPRTDWTRFDLNEPAAATAGPPTRMVRAEEQAELEAAFASLTPEYRRVIGLRQFEGLSASEAALRLGRSETAVHSLYRRALAAWAAATGGDE